MSVLVSRRGPVTVVEIDRPGVRNAAGPGRRRPWFQCAAPPQARA